MVNAPIHGRAATIVNQCQTPTTINKEEIVMNRTFKINFERLSPDHPGVWLPYCMDGFGKGYSFREAEVLKAHLESKKEYRDVRIVSLGGDV